MEYLFSYTSNHSIDGIYEHHVFHIKDTIYVYHRYRANNIIYSIDKHFIINGSIKYKRIYTNMDSEYYDLTNMVDISTITLNYLSIGKYAFFEFCKDYLIYHKATKL